MKLFGTKDSFAVLVGPKMGENCVVEIWVAGAHLTHADSDAYLPSYGVSLAGTIRSLKQRLNFLNHERMFLNLSVEEAFRKLLTEETSEIERAWYDQRTLDLGPTTDAVLCFLIPAFGRLYLAFSDHAAEVIHATPIVPFDLIAVLQAAYDELNSEVMPLQM